MDGLVPIIQSILSDNGGAVKAVLLLALGAVGWLYWNSLKQAKEERGELILMFQKQIETDRKEVIDVIERYQAGQLNVVQAINEIKVLIATIGAKL